MNSVFLACTALALSAVAAFLAARWWIRGRAVMEAARVIAAASSDEKLEICKLHGADATINYATQDLREAIKAMSDSEFLLDLAHRV